jgi:hypothetical protein
MKRDRTEEGKISARGRALGTATPQMVEVRAREIALINGRSRDQVTDSDRDEARRELTGAEAIDPQAEPEARAEVKQWEPAGSGGEQAPTLPAHDEQTDVERLVEEGIAEAEHEQMVEGTKESLKRGD